MIPLPAFKTKQHGESMRGPAKYIAALERREQHLIKRTAEARSKGQRIDYDELEKSALGWALANLRHLVAPRGGK